MSGFKYRVTHDQQLPELAGTEDVPTGQLISRLKTSCRIDIQKLTEEEMVFDLVGVDVSIANALRRILLAELPTMAVETVWVTANTGILQDEILAHRVGLVPIRIDPRLMEFCVDNDLPTDADTLTFHLDVYYPPDDDRPSTSTDVSSLGGRVLSRHLKWLPQGGQQDKFPQGVRPVHDDIVLAQLSPGQRLEFEAHCRKGLGKDHAKFSPVATASYRLLPDVQLLQPLEGALAKELVNMCPMKVFDIEDIGGKGGKGGKSGSSSSGSGGVRAVVARPRDCTMCRECVRKEGWAERVALRRHSDHYIFTVEGTGCLAPHELVREAFGVLRGKAAKFADLAAREGV